MTHPREVPSAGVRSAAARGAASRVSCVSRTATRSVTLAAAVAMLAGCTTAIGGFPQALAPQPPARTDGAIVAPGSDGLTITDEGTLHIDIGPDTLPELPTSTLADEAVGLKPDAPLPMIDVLSDAGASIDEYSAIDQIAASALTDLIDYYTEIFPKSFGRSFSAPEFIISYDSTDPDGIICDESTFDFANAFYDSSCDVLAYDREIMLPQMAEDIGDLATAVIMSHEMGHRVQTLLAVPDDLPSLVSEQQADCYAGAYWRWVADGNSSYFNFNESEGIRQMLLSLFQAKDPVEEYVGPDDDDSHGNGFDRTYAATLGYTEGTARCQLIDAEELALRGQEFPFSGFPQQWGNVDVTAEILADLAATVNEFFTETIADYEPPQLETFDNTAPDCPGYGTSYPVSYCPTTNTVSYQLAQLQRIGTPTAGWDSANGDFSAIVLLMSRYALAAQYAGHSPVVGTNAGLQALCYTGNWASWMRTPRGAEGYALSPNDLDKAIYQIVSSPVAGADASGSENTTIIERVNAFASGVTGSLLGCFERYVTDF